MSLTVPSGGLSAITPSDVTVYTPPLLGLYTGAGGAIAVVLVDGSAVTIANAPAGQWWPISNISKVMATGTTATGLLGWTMAQ